MARFRFRPLARDDTDLIHVWRNQPHVADNWDGPQSLEAIRTEIAELLASPAVEAYVVYRGRHPIAYLQTYDACKVGEGWWENELPGTWGLDQFIGEPELIGRGLGSALVRQVGDELLARPDVLRLIVDPKPTNLAAIGAYKKAGFRPVGEIDTPDGRAFLLERT